MSPSAEYVEYVLEQFAPIASAGPMRTTRFFGGVGLVCGTVQFAMIMANSLYLVVDDITREKYEKYGMSPFSYLTKKGRVQVRRYYELPEDVLTDAEQLAVWVRESIGVAHQKKSRPNVKTRRRVTH